MDADGEIVTSGARMVELILHHMGEQAELVLRLEGSNTISGTMEELSGMAALWYNPDEIWFPTQCLIRFTQISGSEENDDGRR